MVNVFRYAYKIILKSLLFACIAQSAYPQSLYFLCGSDEDGCLQDHESESCACIPVSLKPRQPYCLDLDNMMCLSLSERPACIQSFIFPDQGSCIATLFQSEPYPECSEVRELFCQSHHITKCDEDGSFK